MRVSRAHVAALVSLVFPAVVLVRSARVDRTEYPPIDYEALDAVPSCTRTEWPPDQAFNDCRYQRALERLALIRDPRFRPRYVGAVAMTALDAGRPDVARQQASAARTALAVAGEANQTVPFDVTDTDAIEHIAVVEGRLALAAGDTAVARRRLLDAGEVLASPSQLSFGPNLTLARDLLAASDTAAVRAYFDVLERTWLYGNTETLPAWRAALDRGDAPDFGANLLY